MFVFHPCTTPVWERLVQQYSAQEPKPFPELPVNGTYDGSPHPSGRGCRRTRRATRTIKATDQLLHEERDENETRRVRKHHHTHCSDTAPSATAGCMTDALPDMPGGVIASLWEGCTQRACMTCGRQTRAVTSRIPIPHWMTPTGSNTAATTCLHWHHSPRCEESSSGSQFIRLQLHSTGDNEHKHVCKNLNK